MTREEMMLRIKMQTLSALSTIIIPKFNDAMRKKIIIHFTRKALNIIEWEDTLEGMGFDPEIYR